MINKSSINIFAPNIRLGGGKVLLLNLLEFIDNNHPELIVKVYCNKNILKEIRSRKINVEYTEVNSIFNHIKLLFKKIDNCLYFGNYPPFFKGRNTHLYFHNIFLTNNSFFKVSFMQKIKFLVSKIYIYFTIKNVNTIFCQSSIVKNDIEQTYGKYNVSIVPFFNIFSQSSNIKNYDFCYIASGDKHKNHDLLLDSLKILSEKNTFPSLVLTVENHRTELIKKINTYKEKYSISIQNFGEIDLSDVEKIYKTSKCILFPSLYETFGLPLIEAQKIDIDLLPINLPYVYEVVEPEVSFEPNAYDCAEKILDYIENYNYEKKKNFVVLTENKIGILLNAIKEGL